MDTTDTSFQSVPGGDNESIRIVSGAPDESEIVALMACLAAVRTREESTRSAASVWNNRALLLGGMAPGSDTWKWSVR